MNFVFRGVMLIFLAVSLIGCKERDDILGENYLDSQLEVKYDTIEDVITKSVMYEDSALVLSGATISLLGDYYDNFFGDHKAATAMSFVPSSNEADIGDNPVADSIVLQLQYNGIYYGFDTINPQTIKAYRIVQDIGEIDSTAVSMYEDNGITGYYDPTPIGQTTYRPNTDSTSEFLWIKLNNSIANEFMSNINTTLNDTAFKEMFKGIYLEAERTSGDGAIMSFTNNTADSHLRLHFHNDDDSTLAFYYLPFNSEGELPTHRYNFFEHNYQTGDIVAYNPGNDEFAVDDDLFFAQSMRGINMKIDVDMSNSELFSDEVSNKNIVVNRVLLQLHTTKREGPVDSTEYAPPASFSMYEDASGGLETIIDYYIPEYGISSPVPYNSEDKTYELVLSGFTHEKVKNQGKSYTLFLKPSQPNITAHRGVFYGSGTTDYDKRPKVVVVYSLGTNN